jgi:RNA polymerase sigma factor (sigma-70 family)
VSEKEFLAKLKEYQGIIYKLVHLYADTAEDKKDFYQEIVLQAWKSYPDFRGDSKFSTWLYKLCLHTLLTLKRKENRLQYSHDLQQYESHLTTTPGDEKEMLYKGIRSLPEIDKALVSLHLDGYGNQEISEIMGMSPNLVGVRLHRSKQQLIKFFKA